jgi:hypothetical protein
MSLEISNMQEDRTYYIRPFFQNMFGTFYGKQQIESVWIERPKGNQGEGGSSPPVFVDTEPGGHTGSGTGTGTGSDTTGGSNGRK